MRQNVLCVRWELMSEQNVLCVRWELISETECVVCKVGANE